MSLRKILLSGGAALVSYWAVSNRQAIVNEGKETAALAKKAQGEYNRIQEQLAVLQSYQEPLKEWTADLQHRLQVYQQSIAGNLEELKKIQAKYQPSEKE